MNAAALMTADQYRQSAEDMLDKADARLCGGTLYADHFVMCAQVYALLAISAQAQENANAELPF